VSRPSAIGFASGECRAGIAGSDSGMMGAVEKPIMKGEKNGLPYNERTP